MLGRPGQRLHFEFATGSVGSGGKPQIVFGAMLRKRFPGWLCRSVRVVTDLTLANGGGAPASLTDKRVLYNLWTRARWLPRVTRKLYNDVRGWDLVVAEGFFGNNVANDNTHPTYSAIAAAGTQARSHVYVIPWAIPSLGDHANDTAVPVGDLPENLELEFVTNTIIQAAAATLSISSATYRLVAELCWPDSSATHCAAILRMFREQVTANDTLLQFAQGPGLLRYLDFDNTVAPDVGTAQTCTNKVALSYSGEYTQEAEAQFRDLVTKIFGDNPTGIGDSNIWTMPDEATDTLKCVPVQWITRDGQKTSISDSMLSYRFTTAFAQHNRVDFAIVTEDATALESQDITDALQILENEGRATEAKDGLARVLAVDGEPSNQKGGFANGKIARRILSSVSKAKIKARRRPTDHVMDAGEAGVKRLPG